MTDPTLFFSGTAAAAGAETARGGAVGNGAGRPVTAEGEQGTGGVACRCRGGDTVPGVSADSRVGTVNGAGNGAQPAAESSGAALARAGALLDALVVALRSVGGELLEERLELVGRCEARLASVRSDTVAELTRRDGEARAADAVRTRLRKSRGAAKGDVKLAGQLADLPGTADALAGGAITPQHTRIIAEASEHTDIDETELLDAAESEPTDTFGRTVRDHVNERSDGMYKLFGLFDPVAGARVETALAAEARKLRHSEDPQNRARRPYWMRRQATWPMRAGDVVRCDFGTPARGEPGFVRPAIVVTSDDVLEFRQHAILVVPCTTTRRGWSSEVDVGGFGAAAAHLPTTISVGRIVETAGVNVGPVALGQIRELIADLLGL